MPEREPQREYRPASCPGDWDNDQLEARAGALVNQALARWPASVKQAHWNDMKQTAIISFLEHPDKAATYGYTVASNALKNYVWVHIQGLNGGWKSIEARNYTVLDEPLETDGDRFEAPRDNFQWRMAAERPYEPVPRPVEWAAAAHLDNVGNDNGFGAVCHEILTILAGMTGQRWYPEQLYRAALIAAMLGSDYIWEDVEERTNLSYQEVDDIWRHYRRKSLLPYRRLTPIHQELVKVKGATRLAYFDELTPQLLNQAARKMIIFPHGIYTVIYKRRSRRERGNQIEASLQKARTIGGKSIMRAVSLGKVGELTKERLLKASHQLEGKLEALSNVSGSVDKTTASRRKVFS